MKLKFERYPKVSCLYIRGKVESAKFKILLIGIDSIIRDQEEPLIIHLGHADLPSQEALILAGYKKKMGNPKFPIYWVGIDRGVGDFKNIDLLSQRIFSDPKQKSVSQRIKLDDEIFLLNDQIASLQEEIAKMGGSEESVAQIILENDILKAQKSALDSAYYFLSARLPFQVPIPTDNLELPEQTSKALAELYKLNGGEVDL